MIVSVDFRIENVDDMKLEKVSEGYRVTKELESGRTFHLLVRDVQRQNVKAVIGFISPSLFGIILGIKEEKRER